MAGQSEFGYCCGRRKPSAFKRLARDVKVYILNINPTGLLLIAFDVHVNMTCFNIPAQNIPSSEDRAKGRGLSTGMVGWGGGGFTSQ